MFVIHTAEKDAFVLSDVLKELFHFKWEFLMIHMAGFNHAPAFGVDYLLSPAWYISSMLLALVPFYFLCRRFEKSFAGVIAPLIMMIIYAYIIQNYETIDVGNQFVLGTMLGNCRAFAGMCLGAFVAYLNGFYEKIPDHRKGVAFIQVMDVISWILAVSLFVFPKDVIPDADMIFWMIPFSVILLNSVNNFGLISRWLNSHGCLLWAKLGKLSIYIYLLHMQVILLCKHLYVPKNSIVGICLILAVVLAFSILVMAVWDGIRRYRIKHVS